MAKEIEKRVPKLRFKGFTDDWKQRKLKEFGQATGGTSIESEFIEGGKYKVISIGSYSEQSVYKDQNIRVELTDKTRSRVLNKDDLTMILNDKTTSGNIIGRVLLIESDDSYVYNQRTERIEPDHKKYDSQFLYQMFNAPIIRSKIIKKAQGNTQIYVNWSAISELDYLIPKLVEQSQIGLFFKYLDNCITLHQRKLAQLEKLKQALLQQMFPKKDETVPKLRFANFNEDWKQRKLGELGESKSGIGFPDEEQGGKKGIPFFKVSDMNNIGNEHEMKNSNNYVDTEQLKKRNWKPIMNVPAVIFAKVGAAIMLNRKRIVRMPFLLDNNTMAYIFDDSWNSDFGKILFETIYLPRYAQVGALPSYNSSDINSVKVFIPNKNEQEKNGVFFKELDNLITVHHHKLDQLKLLKKELLQQMFI